MARKSKHWNIQKEATKFAKEVFANLSDNPPTDTQVKKLAKTFIDGIDDCFTEIEGYDVGPVHTNEDGEERDSDGGKVNTVR